MAWSLFTAAGRFDQNACMTAPITHLWRLLKWGRILARHGALTGIEKDPLTQLPVRRLARLARFGALVPKQPRYDEHLQAHGTHAIKLGHPTATRPHTVGPEGSIGKAP